MTKKINTKQKLLLSVLVAMFFLGMNATAQISGTVYRDYNADGIRGTTAPNKEAGIAGILINAYNASDALVSTTTTDGDGNYSIPFSVAVRVECVIPSGQNCTNPNFDFPGFGSGGNNVRFISASTPNVDFGISYADDYVTNTNPEVYTPRYIDGDPLGGGTSGTTGVFLGHEYNSSGSPLNPKELAGSQIGSVWGVAYSKQAKRVFTAAFLKRHVGLGPMGSGGIYMLEPTGSTFNVTQFYDMDANGHRTRAGAGAPAYGGGTSYNLDAFGYTATYLGSIDPVSGAPEGLGVIGANGASGRGLSGNAGDDSNDPAAFDQVGKVGLADLDISSDGKYLFVVNLYSRTIYRLTLNDAYNPTSVTAVSQYSLPTIPVTNGVLRPYGLGFKNGTLYVGATATGENGGTTADMFAYVFELNNATGGSPTFNSTPIITLPLNYTKGPAILTDPLGALWYPWNNNTNNVFTISGEQTYPTPMLSDIGFSDRGDMILSLSDRSGHQFGFQNYWHLSGTTAIFSYDLGGDILMAGKNCSTGAYTLENNGSYNSNGTTYSGGVGNGQGIGGGEFFYNDFFPTWHNETHMGSTATLRGDDKVLVSVMDPITDFTGGTAKFSTSDASRTHTLTLYAGFTLAGSFGKAKGLGDIELAGDEPPIVIGNRVWNDLDGDGIQDANEAGIDNVQVQLFCDFDNNGVPDGAAIATVNTNSLGEYYFDASNVADGDCSLGGNQIGVQPQKNYLIRIGSSSWSGGIGAGVLLNLALTVSNSTGNGQVDWSDNDAQLISGVPQIFVQTGKFGENNHSYDFGFKECVADAGQNISLDCNSPSGIIGTAAVSGNTYSWSPTTGLNDATLAQPTASPTSTTTYTLTVNGLCTDEVTVTVDKVPPTADAGSNQNLDCATTSAMIGTAAISGNTYSWSPATGLSAANIAQPTANPTSTTTYTVTVTGSNGCTASDVVTVDVNTTPPTADAGSNQNLDCTTTSAMIGTAAISGNTYSWSPATGLSATNIAQPTANPTSTTTYTVTVTGSNGCTASDVVTVDVNTTSPTADAGSNQNLDCTTTSAMIGTAAISGSTYSWSPATGLSAANIAQPTANPTSTTIYTVTVTGSNGCTASDVVTIDVNTTPPTADAGSNQNLDCVTTNAMIGTAAISGNTYSWSPATGLSATNIAQPTANPTSTTTYTVTVTGSNGCTASDVVTVDVNTTPPTADAGSNQNLDCTTTSAMIGTAAISGNTYSWSPATGLSAANIAQPTANPTSTTTYTVTVTGSNGCTASDVVTVDVNTTPPTADAGSNQNLDCATTSAMIGTAAISGNTYSWSPAIGLSATNIAQPTASPTSTTVYTVTVTGSNGCTASDVVTVDVNANLGSIGNYVWIDLNANGQNDEPSSAGINGVTVELWTASNVLVNTTTTANDGLGNPGYYNFEVCTSGDYKVRFPSSIGQSKLTLQTTTAATDNNSDANTTDGFSPTFTINTTGTGTDKDNPTIDAGYYELACLGNYVWNDLDQDGTQDANEVGVAGITVTLFNSSNQAIRSTVTDAYGKYTFCSLVPGDYSVAFTLPQNYQFTQSNTPGDNGDNTNSDVNPTSGVTGVFTLTSGETDLTADAGIYFSEPTTASVGNYVWFDTDQDGIQDPNESGISGVTVTLYDNNGNPVATTITDANGFYLFQDVTPGTYSVGMTPPVGLTFSPNNGPVSNASNSDINPLTGMTSTFVVNAGDEITYVDGGLINLPSTVGGLGDKVWYDTDQDGVQDAGEVGVEGVTVTLYGADGTTVLATTTTNTFGNYIFNNLNAGQYVVGFSNLPSGYLLTSTSGTDSTTNSDANVVTGKTGVISLAQGQFNLTYDAGIYTTNTANTNSLGNYVWYDTDKDGIQDATEIGVPGITVTLMDNTNAELDVTTTDANGYYLFPDLANGTYKVSFSNIPPSYGLSAQGQGGDASLDSDPNPSTGMTGTVALTGNTHDMTLDAGIALGNGMRLGLGTLGDLVWYDMDGDGLQDANEAGVPGVTATLYASNGTTVLATTTTDALGNYIFTGLESGGYYVGFTNLPSGFTISPKNADNEGINGGVNSDVNSGTGLTDIVFLGSGEDKMTVDMGIVPPAGIASLGNYVWIDLNNDGLQTSGEPGVPGITVTLYDNANNQIAVTTTNINGEYYFVGLTPGSYSVGFTNLPDGYSITTQNADAQGVNGALNSDANPSTGLSNSVTLVAGDNNLNLDAGIVSTTVASVGDYVWYDADQDGEQDATEMGIGGILVTLYDNNGNPVASTITNSNGGYLFTNVIPGEYTIGFSNIPSGFIFTTQESNTSSNTGSNANVSTGITPSFTVTAGTHNPTIDAGLTIPQLAGLGDYVWYDANNNGQQDANETAIAGTTVTLYASDGTTVIATAITDGNGAYSFTNLQPGSYIVGFSDVPNIYEPSGSVFIASPTTGNQGADETDSDMGVDGKTGVYTLAAGDYNPTVDAGFIYQFALPIQLSHFGASIKGCTTILTWATSSEQQSSHIDIERKTPQGAYTKVGSVQAKGSSSTLTSYTYSDAVGENGSYIYRLKMVDIDGRYSYSTEKSVTLNCTENEIVLYPNPTQGNSIVLLNGKEMGEIYEVSVLDMRGAKVYSTAIEISSQSELVNLPLENLSSGIYSVQVTNGTDRAVFKLNKQ